MGEIDPQFRSQWIGVQQEQGVSLDDPDIVVIDEETYDPDDPTIELITLPGLRVNNLDERVVQEYVAFRLGMLFKVRDDMTTKGTDAAAKAALAQQAADNANAKAALANTAATNADNSRQQIEANENTRKSNETTRQSQESARQQQSASDHQTATQDHSTATSDHTQATQDHQTASGDHTQAGQDHSRAEQDHTASVNATNGASNVDANLNGMTVTITDRNGVSRSLDLSFDFYASYPSVAAMQADAANIPKCSLVSIATTDKTSAENARIYQKRSDGTMIYLGDLDQASAQAWADWLETQKPAIEAKIAQAEADHVIAAGDHSTAGSDHTQAVQDHQTASGDHTQAGQDHSRAEQDHTTATGDHTQAGQDHDRAVNMASHPAYIADGTSAKPGDVNFWYIWDYATQQYVRDAYSKGDDLHWDEMSDAEKDALAAKVRDNLVVATLAEAQDAADELT